MGLEVMNNVLGNPVNGGDKEKQSNVSRLMNNEATAVLGAYGLQLSDAKRVKHTGTAKENNVTSTYTFNGKNNLESVVFEHVGGGERNANAASIRDQGYAQYPHNYKITVTEKDGDKIIVLPAETPGQFKDDQASVRVVYTNGKTEYLGPIDPHNYKDIAQQAKNKASANDPPTKITPNIKP